MNSYFKLLILCLLLSTQKNLSGNEKNFANDSLKIVRLTRKGIDLYRNGMHADALDSFLLSLELRKENYQNNDYTKFASIYRYIAIEYKNLGFYDLSIQYSQLAEQAYIKGYGENDERIALVYLNLGNVYRGKLSYNEALTYFRQMVSVYNSQKKVNRADIAGAYYSIAEIYFRLYKYDDAIKAIEQHFDDAYESDKILFYDLLGAIYQEQNKNQEAITYYKKAIQSTITLYSDKDIGLATEYMNFAYFLTQIGKTDQALNELEKARAIISLYEKEGGVYYSSYYRNLGILAENKHISTENINEFKIEKNKNLLEAIQSYKNALQALNFPINISSSTTLKLDTINNISDMDCLDLLKLIGNAYIEISNIYQGENIAKYSNNINQALDYYEVAGAFVQQIRKEISGDESKILLAGQEQSTFNAIVKTSYLAYHIDGNISHLNQAFTNAERLKSGSIIDKLEGTMAIENSLIPDSLEQQKQFLNSKITNYKEQRFNEMTSIDPDSSVIANADAMITKLNQDRLELDAYLKNNYRNYYDLKYSSTLLELKDIQHRLKNDEALIEYVLNETDTVPELYSILIESNSAKFIKQNIDNQFINNIESFFKFMSSQRYVFTTNEDAKVFCVNSYKLYQKLIEPFEKEIQDKKITIVPDGKLNYIAFDGLIDEMPDTTKNIRFNNLNYLIKKNCINYSYSANLLYKFDDLSRKANRSVLAFAPEYQTDTFTFDNQRLVLMPLPGVKKEVNNISHEVKTKVFEGADATEINFRENVENYDVLHLAMHAFINDSLPAFSRLAFAQNTGNQPDDDGWLNTADIYNLNLNARLTVLSACNTGTGKLQKGEGVMSLARGFLYAGCPSIIMTLWETEDNAGTQIMSSFYKYLKKGKPKDEALRLAKLDYLNSANPRLAHPHYWLSYVTIGNSTPLYRSYDFYFFSLLILAFIGIATEQVIRIKKARKKRTF